jgi:hypothetical protein
MAMLDGKWAVRRVSGLLPPFGISKRIGPRSGVTCIAGIPVAPFRVEDNRLIYRLLPIQDELNSEPDGSWSGRGFIWGREFCRFRLVPA